MKQDDFTRFLEEQLTDPDFARAYRDEAPKVDLGVTIALARERRSLTQTQLARHVGARKHEINDIEMGNLDEVPLALLNRIAQVLGLRLIVKLAPDKKVA
ncbi:MAG: helix-turn-helix domain-containing protein [Acidobacteria bacterium]|nr:helix-turn-helix domain-containing protein [Acidobacteriota bacterium]